MEVEESSGEVSYTLLAVLITAKSNSAWNRFQCAFLKQEQTLFTYLRNREDSFLKENLMENLLEPSPKPINLFCQRTFECRFREQSKTNLHQTAPTVLRQNVFRGNPMIPLPPSDISELCRRHLPDGNFTTNGGVSVVDFKEWIYHVSLFSIRR